MEIVPDTFSTELMDKRAKKLVVVTAGVTAVIAVIGLSWGGRSSSTDSSNEGWNHDQPATSAVAVSSTTPVTGVRPNVASPASEGEKQAAALSVAFEAAKRCAVLARSIDDMQSQIKACEAGASDANFHASCSRNTQGFAEKVEKASSEMAGCNHADLEQSKEAFFQSTVAAAKAGNPDAQMCYVASDFDLNRPWTREEVAAYKADVGAYANAAMNRGDWRIVQAFMTSPRVLGHMNGLLGLIDDGNPVTIYKMNRLARLGASGAYAARLDSIALDPDSPLPAQTVTEADTWARTMYQDHFSQSPKLESQPETCH